MTRTAVGRATGRARPSTVSGSEQATLGTDPGIDDALEGAVAAAGDIERALDDGTDPEAFLVGPPA